MVNSLVKSYTLLLLLLVLCLSSYGQSIKGRYISKFLEGGVLFHLLEETLFEDEHGNKLSHDLTYNSTNDSLIFNFSFVYDKTLLLDSISLKSEDVDVHGKLKRLYIEPKGKRWMHRYTLNTKAEPFFHLYNPEAKPQITLYRGDDEEYIYSAKRSAWKKYAPVGRLIFEVIELQNAK